MQRPGMLSVTWDIPALTPVPLSEARVPLDQRPPQFIAPSRCIPAIPWMSMSNPTRVPPWLPEIVLDDSTNTLLRFRGTPGRDPRAGGQWRPAEWQPGPGPESLVRAAGAWGLALRPGRCGRRWNCETRKGCACGSCARFHPPPSRSARPRTPPSRSARPRSTEGGRCLRRGPGCWFGPRPHTPAQRVGPTRTADVAGRDGVSELGTHAVRGAVERRTDHQGHRSGHALS